MRNSLRFLWLAVLVTACDSPAAPGEATRSALSHAMAAAAPHALATGTFTQNAITSLAVRQAGPNTILQQTSLGTVSGTLAGSYTDELRVVIHPNGRFNAHFTVRCVCTVDGAQGIIQLVASDAGVLISPTLASFSGQATITDATGELDGLRGVFEIDGTVDVPSGLSTYTYSGRIH